MGNLNPMQVTLVTFSHGHVGARSGGGCFAWRSWRPERTWRRRAVLKSKYRLPTMSSPRAAHPAADLNTECVMMHRPGLCPYADIANTHLRRKRCRNEADGEKFEPDHCLGHCFGCTVPLLTEGQWNGYVGLENRCRHRSGGPMPDLKDTESNPVPTEEPVKQQTPETEKRCRSRRKQRGGSGRAARTAPAETSTQASAPNSVASPAVLTARKTYSAKERAQKLGDIESQTGRGSSLKDAVRKQEYRNRRTIIGRRLPHRYQSDELKKIW